MGRHVMRVPSDFFWPIGREWYGYETFRCDMCEGTGIKPPFDHPEKQKCDRCNGEGLYCPDIAMPVGEAWQMWETSSAEGSPMSPVFGTPEELAQWLEDTDASAFADETATYEQWLAVITGPGGCAAFVQTTDGIVSDVEFQGDALLAQKINADMPNQDKAKPGTTDGGT